MSAWVYSTRSATSWIINKRGATSQIEYQLATLATTNQFVIQQFNQLGSTIYIQSLSDSTAKLNKWVYITLTYNGAGKTGWIWYYNGLPSTGTASNVGAYVAMKNGTASMGIGTTAGNWGSGSFKGNLDEVRMSKGVRSAAWIKFCYFNMSSATNELTWGALQKY
jgi:hypothetical protein